MYPLFAAMTLAAVISLGSAPSARGVEGPVKIVFPFSAGGSGDAVARHLSERLGADLGRTVLVENRTGASGRLAVQAVKSAKPDGNTLLLTPFSLMTIYPVLYKNLGYDPIADFSPISQVASFEFAVAVTERLPVSSVHDMVAWIKGQSGGASYGTPGAGTLQHFFGMAIGKAAGAELRHVGYRGASGVSNDLIAGHLPIGILSTADLLQHHRSGSVRIVATLGEERSLLIPELPTFKESGYPISGDGWFGLYAPAGTPSAVLARIESSVIDYAATAEFKKKLLTLGLSATGTTGVELARIQARETETWVPLVRASGFQPTD